MVRWEKNADSRWLAHIWTGCCSAVGLCANRANGGGGTLREAHALEKGSHGKFVGRRGAQRKAGRGRTRRRTRRR